MFLRWTWPFIVLVAVFFLVYTFMPRESWISLSATPENIEIQGFNGGAISSFRSVIINQGFLVNSSEITISIDNEIHHVAAGQLMIVFYDLGTHWNSILIEGRSQASLYTAGNQRLYDANISIRDFSTPLP